MNIQSIDRSIVSDRKSVQKKDENESISSREPDQRSDSAEELSGFNGELVRIQNMARELLEKNPVMSKLTRGGENKENESGSTGKNTVLTEAGPNSSIQQLMNQGGSQQMEGLVPVIQEQQSSIVPNDATTVGEVLGESGKVQYAAGKQNQTAQTQSLNQWKLPVDAEIQEVTVKSSHGHNISEEKLNTPAQGEFSVGATLVSGSDFLKAKDELRTGAVKYDRMGVTLSQSNDGEMANVRSEDASSHQNSGRKDDQPFKFVPPSLDLRGKAQNLNDQLAVPIDRFEQPNLAVSGGMEFQMPRVAPRTVRSEMSGDVVPGSMMKNRLTSSSVMHVADQISSLPGGSNGMVRIRLNPESLGEVNLQISTRGDQVALKVLSSDPQAKLVFEESIKALETSLASHKLNLSRVEYSSQPAGVVLGSGDSTGVESQSQHNQQNSSSFSGFQDQSRQSAGERYREQGGNSERFQPLPLHSRSDVGPGVSRAAGGATVAGRLNVMA